MSDAGTQLIGLRLAEIAKKQEAELIRQAQEREKERLASAKEELIENYADELKDMARNKFHIIFKSSQHRHSIDQLVHLDDKEQLKELDDIITSSLDFWSRWHPDTLGLLSVWCAIFGLISSMSFVAWWLLTTLAHAWPALMSSVAICLIGAKLGTAEGDLSRRWRLKAEYKFRQTQTALKRAYGKNFLSNGEVFAAVKCILEK